MSCPTCGSDYMPFNYCNLCGWPPDDAESLLEMNKQVNQDFAALSPEEQRNATEGKRETYR